MVSNSSDSFLLNLSYSKIPIKTLLNSGATHCFLDSSFVSDHRLPVQSLPQPLCLCLFDGSFSADPIVYEVTLLIHFDHSHTIPITFLVTPLDPDITAVLRISWLHQQNLLIDWASSCIDFYLFIFSVGGKEGNASCTIMPSGAMCGTPVWLADGSILPVGQFCQLTYPLKPSHTGDTLPHPII